MFNTSWTIASLFYTHKKEFTALACFTNEFFLGAKVACEKFKTGIPPVITNPPTHTSLSCVLSNVI